MSVWLSAGSPLSATEPVTIGCPRISSSLPGNQLLHFHYLNWWHPILPWSAVPTSGHPQSPTDFTSRWLGNPLIPSAPHPLPWSCPRGFSWVLVLTRTTMVLVRSHQSSCFSSDHVTALLQNYQGLPISKGLSSLLGPTRPRGQDLPAPLAFSPRTNWQDLLGAPLALGREELMSPQAPARLGGCCPQGPGVC